MYSLAQVKRGLSHPNLIIREFNRLYHTRLDSLRYNEAGFGLMEADWDFCHILDACRYDMFAEHSSLPGMLSKRVSRGSNTVEFLRGNFETGTYHDTVYVTANPQYRRYENQFDAEFHDVVDVWANDGWDDTYNTVLPETTTEYALEAADRYPHKRLLVHFIQPHYPFLVPDSTFDKTHLHDEGAETDDFWHRIFYGELDVDPSYVWSLYRKSLDEALPHVERLLTSVEGKHVVTADHGNMVGERAAPLPVREWGHPEGIYVPKLVEVPWLEYTNGERRRVTPTRPRQGTSVDDNAVRERLRTLGYRE
ncbi:type 2 periplasmic-binding domain-containing protein [Halanaeroarchaeum sulfurireducens]|uniref:Sulfatase n=1 Tax=Halanaeroarchaeum sulfurireducens TaxID=1604004 RepID=A0A0F7PFA4_9EURY|nr:hypothetical protein [Halanaeroarchaeum sulfurireducens]AKH98003.1 hypothetical protein HLASF_1524 [Halanaeroarchaeum sulfurireducens]ALG82397.1 hypothetical protein HLASA_1511 [Halanaeroarchaeum sulfurireducens]